MERGKAGSGRYPRFISQNFPHGVVIPTGEHRNLFCRCATPNWMICTIHVLAGSSAERLVRAKLNRANPSAMLPFFINRYVQMSDPLDPHPIVFAHPYCMPVIYAQIEIEPFYSAERREKEPPLRRSNSAPARLENPPKLIGMSQCTQRTCPITLERLRPGTDVFILKSTQEDLREKKRVPCISGEGLRQAALNSERGAFMDPYRREHQQRLNIYDDYTQYVLFDDTSDPVCPLTSSEDSPSGRSDSGSFNTPQQASTAGESSSGNGNTPGSDGVQQSPGRGSPNAQVLEAIAETARTIQLQNEHDFPTTQPTVSDAPQIQRVASSFYPAFSVLMFAYLCPIFGFVSWLLFWLLHGAYSRNTSLYSIHLEFKDNFLSDEDSDFTA